MVTLLVDRVVIGILPISAWPMQVVCPSRPLEVTVVCAKAEPASAAVTSAAALVAKILLGVGAYSEFHLGSPCWIVEFLLVWNLVDTFECQNLLSKTEEMLRLPIFNRSSPIC